MQVEVRGGELAHLVGPQPGLEHQTIGQRPGVAVGDVADPPALVAFLKRFARFGGA
ncbi:MAG: hypothetical protein AAF711_05000 [Planctomycetota bacterium]